MDQILGFIHETSYADLPGPVRAQVVRCVLDTIGSLCGGRGTKLSRIIRQHAVDAFGGDEATIMLDGRRCSAPGAALANGMTIDSLDIHDSHRDSLGHAGVHVISTALATEEQLKANEGIDCSGQDFMTAVAVGYDIACRAGIALHATVADYHTSGAWGAVSSAALYSRLHRLSTEKTRHALGIAEYHGPRSQMMRCIDHPTMVKDGSGWGAMAGICAGMLAQRGFTGAPAITVESCEVGHVWEDLGSRWLIMEQGFKVHGVCWWAQPAIEAALSVAGKHQLDATRIERIEVETFEKATRLSHPRPLTSEEAQYSLPYPLAAALIARSQAPQAWPGVGPRQLLEGGLRDSRVLELAERVALMDAADLTAQFPARFLARVRIIVDDGRVYSSGAFTFRGEQDHPLSDEELHRKFRWLAAGVLSADRLQMIESFISTLPEQESLNPLIEYLAPAPDVALQEQR